MTVLFSGLLVYYYACTIKINSEAQHEELEKKLLDQMVEHLHTKEKEFREEIEKKVRITLVVLEVQNTIAMYLTPRKRNHLKHNQKNWKNGKGANKIKLRSASMHNHYCSKSLLLLSTNSIAIVAL